MSLRLQEDRPVTFQAIDLEGLRDPQGRTLFIIGHQIECEYEIAGRSAAVEVDLELPDMVQLRDSLARLIEEAERQA